MVGRGIEIKSFVSRQEENEALTIFIISFGTQATNENVNLAPKVIRDLARELKNLDDSPPEDIKVYVNEENFSNVTADIEGPRIVFKTFFFSVAQKLTFSFYQCM